MLRTIFSTIVLILALITSGIAQNPEWIQYTNGDYVQALAADGDYIWVGTSVGLVKVNRISDVTTFYNNANSDLPDNNIT